MRHSAIQFSSLSALLFIAATVCLHAQDAATPAADPSLPANPAIATPKDYVLMTFILRQDQSRNLQELQQVMKDQRFWADFPPDGIVVDSWYVAVGLGHVITLRVPPARLREVNLAMERSAWKIFRTETYPSYDLKQVAEGFREKAKQESVAP